MTALPIVRHFQGNQHVQNRPSTTYKYVTQYYLMNRCVYIALSSLLLLFVVVAINFKASCEAFTLASRNVCPTRNQSYDIRGDPIAIPRVDWPLNNATNGPQNPQLCRYKQLG